MQTKNSGCFSLQGLPWRKASARGTQSRSHKNTSAKYASDRWSVALCGIVGCPKILLCSKPRLTPQTSRQKSSPFLLFHRTAARSMLGAGGPLAPQSAHWTMNVPVWTIWGLSPQNGHGFSIGTISCSIFSSLVVVQQVCLISPCCSRPARSAHSKCAAYPA